MVLHIKSLIVVLYPNNPFFLVPLKGINQNWTRMQKNVYFWAIHLLKRATSAITRELVKSLSRWLLHFLSLFNFSLIPTHLFKGRV